jgi:hypothetical protein
MIGNPSTAMNKSALLRVKIFHDQALLTIVAAASIHSHLRGDHYEG